MIRPGPLVNPKRTVEGGLVVGYYLTVASSRLIRSLTVRWRARAGLYQALAEYFTQLCKPLSSVSITIFVNFIKGHIILGRRRVPYQTLRNLLVSSTYLEME